MPDITETPDEASARFNREEFGTLHLPGVENQSPLARLAREWAASSADASADRLTECVAVERRIAAELRAVNASTVAPDPELEANR